MESRRIFGGARSRGDIVGCDTTRRKRKSGESGESGLFESGLLRLEMSMEMSMESIKNQ